MQGFDRCGLRRHLDERGRPARSPPRRRASRRIGTPVCTVALQPIVCCRTVSRKQYKWILVALLWVVALLNYLDRQIIFSVFPLLKADLQVSDVQLGFLGTAF